MNTTNDVFQVLVANGSAVAKDTQLGNLSAGEWGIFDYETHAQIDLAATPFELPDKFVFAVNHNGNIYTSAGEYIPLSEIKAKDKITSQSSQNAKLKFTPDTSKVTQSEYLLKVEFRGNSDLMVRFGRNAASKIFAANLYDVDDDTLLSTELLAQLYEAVANDVDRFMKVKITGTHSVAEFDPTTQLPGQLTATQQSNLATLRSGTYTDEAVEIEILTLSEMYAFAGINPKYFELRNVKPVLSTGGKLFGTFEQTQAMAYPNTLGYDIQQLEYEAFGFNQNVAGVYRQSNLTGLTLGNFDYQADANKTYPSVYTFQYILKSESGWKEYKNSLSTIVVAGNTDAATDIEKVYGAIG